MSWRATLALALLCTGCVEAAPGGSGHRAEPQSGLCTEIEEGCACEGKEPARACSPQSAPSSADAQLCYEGTRHCRQGVWSGCEDVHGYARPRPTATSALVDKLSPHP